MKRNIQAALLIAVVVVGVAFLSPPPGIGGTDDAQSSESSESYRGSSAWPENPRSTPGLPG